MVLEAGFYTTYHYQNYSLNHWHLFIVRQLDWPWKQMGLTQTSITYRQSCKSCQLKLAMFTVQIWTRSLILELTDYIWKASVTFIFQFIRSPGCKKSLISFGQDAIGKKKINLNRPSWHVLRIYLRQLNLKENFPSNLFNSSCRFWIWPWSYTNAYCIKNDLKLQQDFPVQNKVTFWPFICLCCVTVSNPFSLSTDTTSFF